MALTRTTLSAAVLATDAVFPLTSSTSLVVGMMGRVDNEFVKVVSLAPNVVRRGMFGSNAVAHQILSQFTFGLASDFPDAPAGQFLYVEPNSPWGSATIGADGTIGAGGVIEIPNKDTIIEINKATACAITLTAPTLAQNGVKLLIRSLTAAAHTVTYTAGFYGDTTSSDVATFAAKVGASFTIEASNGLWGVVSLANVTLA